MMGLGFFFWLILYPQIVVLVHSKECTNIPTPLQSHTSRYQLSLSKNQTWKNELFSHYHHNNGFHLTHTDEFTWANLFPPRKMLKKEHSSSRITSSDDEISWNAVYRKIKNPERYNLEGNSFLKEVSLHDVRLDSGSLQAQAQETNLEYLLLLDADNLAWSFRKTAGIDTPPGKPYGGWERPNVEIRGHFVGHYMSATAQMWASTHNETLKARMTALVSALKECQYKMGTGYLSAFPSELFDRFEAIQPVWAPYYTIHKIMAGLLDQYTFANNPQALKMVSWMADYFYKRVQNVIAKYTIERHWMSLNEEVGGMNDVLYRLYSITGAQKHLMLAHLFDKPCFLGILAMKADHISGFHANAHIPLVVGAQMRYEVTRDELYKEIGTFFMDIINATHRYATGGTSVSEFWIDPMRLADYLSTENEESCTTYNMLKVSRNLFRWTKDGIYADYYERALTNGVLSIQKRKEPGVMIYMLPLGHGVSKAVSYHGWGTKFDSFWCCYGTGIESFSKLGDSIYFEEDGNVPGLYVIQYVSSSIEWRSRNIFLAQEVENVASWDQRLEVALTVTAAKDDDDGMTSTLNLRIPSWTNSKGAKAILNEEALKLPSPGNFLSISRKWRSGDKISLELPLELRTEAIQDDRPNFASLHAILYGPYLLAGHSDGDYEIKTGVVKSPSDWITPVQPNYNLELVSLSQKVKYLELFISRFKKTVVMEQSPAEAGTSSSVHATFRIILKDISSVGGGSIKAEDVINKVVMLEPFDLPGMVVAQNGEGKELAIVNRVNGKEKSYQFEAVRGLNGNNKTVSLKSMDDSEGGCYIYRDGMSLQLRCKSGSSSDPEFDEAVSFIWNAGRSGYHPISFIAKGLNRNYILQPLLIMRDEFYNVYFDISD